MCDPQLSGECDEYELPIYTNQLILRSRIGSEFHARLTVIGRGYKPYDDGSSYDDEVWYEFDGIITNVAMSFAPDGNAKSFSQLYYNWRD